MPLDIAPDRIGRYELKGLIARGGMGRLYLARDPNTNRLVVLKLLDATLDSSDIRDRFDREARALASLNHPNIIHIYDYGDFRDSPFIAMEYVRGETLEEKIRRQAPMSVGQKLALLSELCAGLAHAHESGIIHRDIKPANVMVDQDGRLKILDFGIARVSGSNLTHIGTLASLKALQIGTPGYMSPEQTQGSDIDRRTDIFAVGAVAYELFSSREAFPGKTPLEIEARVMRTPPASLASRVPGIDPEIDVILAKALARDRENRYGDAAALGDAFERCRVRLQPSSPPAPTRRPTPAPAAGGSSPASRAATAYERATVACQEQAFETARRFAIEALAEDPAHTAARGLLTRLDQEVPPSAQPRPVQAAVVPPPRPAAPPPQVGSAAPSGSPRRARTPDVVSSDATVLIARPNRIPEPPSQFEETVLIRREDFEKSFPRPAEPDFLSPPPQRERTAPQPTVIGTVRKPQAASPAKKPFSLAPLWLRLKALGSGLRVPSRARPSDRSRAAAGPRTGGLWTPSTRGALMAVAGFAIAGLVVFGVFRLGRWFWPSGQQITANRPVGGTLVGAGLQCGTRGSDCSATRPDDEAVEFQAVADAGYVFSGFTGDCAPAGRMVMSGARTCGATFDPVAAASTVSWALTITKPAGGTVVGAGGILCGSLGTQCSADLPDGVPVTLHVEPDAGFAFLHFTDDCADKGETMMTAARTCGATFAPSAAPVRIDTPAVVVPRPANGSRGPRVIVEAPPPPATPSGPAVPSSSPATAGGPSTPAPIPSQLPTVVAQAERPISPEEHAQQEIEQLIGKYCSELETLKPERVQKLFHTDQRALKDQFKQYKSLSCKVTTEKPKFPVLTISQSRGEGSAQVLFEMKQEIQMKSGGAPQVSETNVTMFLSRASQTVEWLIDRVEHKPKPKS